jgi:hypothetical protein
MISIGRSLACGFERFRGKPFIEPYPLNLSALFAVYIDHALFSTPSIRVPISSRFFLSIAKSPLPLSFSPTASVTSCHMFDYLASSKPAYTTRFSTYLPNYM